MTNRRNEITAAIAAQIDEAATAAAARELPKGDVLVSRTKAIAAFADNTVYEKFELIDPALCRPSPENARVYEDLNFENCSDLIDSLKAEGKQRFPAIVRPTGDEAQPYEIIAGMRRHFAVSWLRNNHYPDFQYLVHVQKLDDETAFRLSDIENRARHDITDLERARSYADALVRHYGNSQTVMAERLNIAGKTLRRYLDLAELDPVFISALGGKEMAKVSHARELKPELLKSINKRTAMTELAADIAEQQKSLAEEGKPLIAPVEVIRKLKAATSTQSKRTDLQPIRVTSAQGATLFEYVAPTSRTGFSLKIPAKREGDVQELKDAVLQLLDKLYGEG